MKKLKYLLIPIFSLLFFINVNAETISVSSVQIKPLENYKNNNSGATDNDFVDYLLSYFSIPSDITEYNYNIYALSSDGGNSNSLKFYFKTSENKLPLNNYQNQYFLFWNNSIGHSYECQYGVDFNNNGNVTSFSKYYCLKDTFSQFSLIPGAYGYTYIIKAENYDSILYQNLSGYSTGYTNSFSIDNGIIYNYGENIPTYFTNGNRYTFGELPAPSYSYTTTILENGNVKLDLSLNNYTSDSGYGFVLENMVTNEEYGITNPYSNIFPNIIPYGTSYSIELSYDTYLSLTLYKYNQIEDTSLYLQEEIETILIDINNTFFNTSEQPYFTITKQTKNLIEGKFVNTTSSMTCWYKYNDSQSEQYTNCSEGVGFSYYENGYAEVIIKKNNNVIYNRKINFLGGSLTSPYLVYDIIKRDFYSVVNWYVENNNNNLTYRYSLDNGSTFTNWSSYNENSNNSISVFDNNTIIVEIANNDQSTIYDSKAIIVINDVSSLSLKNGSIGSIVNKFDSIFNVNSNVLTIINSFWSKLKYSNVYLFVFIPFLTSIICAIIYLIRRK